MAMIRVGREALLTALEAAEPGVSSAKGDIIEQSYAFIFYKGEVITFNDEVSCRVPSPLGKDFTGAVRAKPLLDILRKLDEEEVRVGTVENEFVIKGKGRRSAVGMEHDIALPVSSLEKPTEWAALHDDFLEAVRLVHQCASKDQGRFVLTCLHIHPKRVEACDDFQACRWRLPTGVREPILVRKTSVQHIVGLGMTELCETDEWLHFRGPRGVMLSCRRYLGEYPDLRQSLTVENATKAVLPKGLEEAIAKAQIFSQENQENDQIRVTLADGKLTLRGQGSYGWHEEGPMSVQYTGDPLVFWVSPNLLTEVVKQYSECELAPDRLRVAEKSENGKGRWVYITYLSPPEPEGAEPDGDGGDDAEGAEG